MFHETSEDVFESKIANYLKNAPGKVIDAAGKQQTQGAGQPTPSAKPDPSNQAAPTRSDATQ